MVTPPPPGRVVLPSTSVRGVGNRSWTLLNMTGLDAEGRKALTKQYNDWEHAKWSFKATLIVDIVVVKHLVETHLLVSAPMAHERILTLE